MATKRAATAAASQTTITERAKPSSSAKSKRSRANLPGLLYMVDPGCPHPLGATPDANGVNFSVFSQNATSVELLIFNRHEDREPSQVIRLDPARHKTFHFWHAYVRGLKSGVCYAYRVDGPEDCNIVEDGMRFNPNKVLVDPYGKGASTRFWDRARACGPDDNVTTSMRSVIIDLQDYDWEGDETLKRPMSETVIYEMHVGGFTKSPTSGAAHPGTFLGIIEKIPYLKQLGVTAVELLPVQQFDQTEVGGMNPVTGQPLSNYWGYSTVGFFAPAYHYCVAPGQGNHIREFRDMVKALHKAGIEVILDVVFNHTSEGNHAGPTISFRGFDNSIYYHTVPHDKQYYMDYSGCGNTVNCNHPIVGKFILECLEFWVKEMHVDGFRFDEGSILSRGEDGTPMAHPPVVWQIELSETLADTKIIAEAWDAAGLYQIGYFPGLRWAEWNGRYRDDVRRFVRGDGGMIGAVASRMAGSADLYEANGHLPINSINFVTCHDGFTLNDLVSYNGKHNDGNGEGNRDGIDENMSWNCGWEGESNDPAVEGLRRQQIKNFAAILLLSQGTPMLLGGDEIRRTQQGNNNAYCQDNEISWYDWTKVEGNKETLRFFQRMVAFRRSHPVLHRSRFFRGEINKRGLPDIAWHGCELDCPGWDNPDCRVLALTLGGFDDDSDLHIMLNMEPQPNTFMLPTIAGRVWKRAVDTSLPSPNDIAEPGKEVTISGSNYIVNGRSVVVLMSSAKTR